jgi:hypothetical protein
VIPAVVAVLLYAHTLGGTWVYDDRFHAHDDPRLKEPGRWREYLTEGYFPGGVDHLWRPLVSASYAVQWKVFGERAWAFHLVNVLLHAAASALVAVLARRLGSRFDTTAHGPQAGRLNGLTGGLGSRLSWCDRVALIAGLLFAAHPVHVEGVAYIVGRADSLCAVGALGALVLMLRPLSAGRALAVIACVAVAVLSKEQGLLVPLMLAAVWFMRTRESQPSARERAAGRLLAVLLLFALAGYVIYRDRILPWYWEKGMLDYATQPMIRSGLRDRVLIPFALLGRAVGLLVLPVKLSPEYGLAVITSRQAVGDLYLYLGIAAAVTGTAGAVVAWRRRAWSVVFLLGCAGLTYGMVANVMLIGVVFAERLLYLPSAFVLILVALGVAKLPARVAVVVTVALVATWGVRTVTYAARWNDRLGFYEASVAEQPRSARLRVLLATELLAKGDVARARRVVEEGLAVAPDYWKLWTTGAWVTVTEGRIEEARRMVKRAWELDPFVPDVLAVEERIREEAGTRPPTGSD